MFRRTHMEQLRWTCLLNRLQNETVEIMLKIHMFYTVRKSATWQWMFSTIYRFAPGRYMATLAGLAEETALFWQKAGSINSWRPTSSVNRKSPINGAFIGKISYKLMIFHCYVGLPEGRHCVLNQTSNTLVKLVHDLDVHHGNTPECLKRRIRNLSCWEGWQGSSMFEQISLQSN